MKLLSGIFIALFYIGASSAGECEYASPEFKQLSYQKGTFLPVYFSGYQLDLSGEPSGFLSGDGFVAAYPDKGYVGIQHLNAVTMDDSLPRLAKGMTSVSDFYRFVYDIASSMDGSADKDELNLQRALLKLDCKADVVLYQLGDIQIVFHGATTDSGFHKVMLLSGSNVELITIRGTRDFALQIVASIKRR